MQKYDYDLKTWIIIAVFAVVCIVVDILIWTGVLGGGHQIMKDTSVITILVSGYILFESIQGIIKRLKERNQKDDT